LQSPHRQKKYELGMQSSLRMQVANARAVAGSDRPARLRSPNQHRQLRVKPLFTLEAADDRVRHRLQLRAVCARNNEEMDVNRTTCMTAALVTALAGLGSAHAVTYEGTLSNGASMTGTVGGFSWEDEDAAQADFWLFGGAAGDTVTIAVVRSVAGLDPAMTLYAGTTTADGSQFLNDADWGGLVYLATADDEVDHAGPGGDPLLASFVLPFAGDYTVAIGGIMSLTNGPYDYTVTFNAVPVPEPMPAAMLLGGLALLTALRRKQRRDLP
jgi:hypothetical protein